MKKIKSFDNPGSETPWTHEGDFIVTKNMVKDGMLIKEKIPNVVKGEFKCMHLKITSLKNCPKEIHGNFQCSYNLITSLEFCPEKVGGDFWFTNNKLTSLEFCPKEIHGHFSCNYNELTSLRYCPEKVVGGFHIFNNKLSNLNHGPKFTNGDIYADEHLKIEVELLQKGYTDYYPDLLKHCIEENIDLELITHWPEGFLTEEIKTSAKGLSKFDL